MYHGPWYKNHNFELPGRKNLDDTRKIFIISWTIKLWLIDRLPVGRKNTLYLTLTFLKLIACDLYSFSSWVTFCFPRHAISHCFWKKNTKIKKLLNYLNFIGWTFHYKCLRSTILYIKLCTETKLFSSFFFFLTFQKFQMHVFKLTLSNKIFMHLVEVKIILRA